LFFILLAKEGIMSGVEKINQEHRKIKIKKKKLKKNIYI